jgi:hypothetical protein
MPRPVFSFAGLVFLSALPLLIVIVIGYAPAPITSNASFFTLSIDGTPQVNITAWTLVVDGSVDHPLIFTYENLTSLPNETEVARLQCVSGPSGTAEWTGVRLDTILAMAGVHLGSMDVVFYGMDGYTSSLTWPSQNSSNVLLAYMMNGVSLPSDQGYPLRVVAPNALGYKWVKWIYRIEVVNYDYKGYWESRGWSDYAYISSTNDWRLHATLMSISLIFGTLAAISGVKLSPTMTDFKDYPSFISRRFHVVASVLFLTSAIVTFAYWVTSTLEARGLIFYTLHGIIGLLSVGLLVFGAIMLVPKLRRSRRSALWHGKFSLYGYGLFVLTILLGFALTSGIYVFSLQ